MNDEAEPDWRFRNPRQERILELVRRRGFAAIEAMAAEFGVTAQTIRRDVNGLCQQALLRRYHGGAGLPSSVENLAYATRQVLFLEEKTRIAAEVATQAVGLIVEPAQAETILRSSAADLVALAERDGLCLGVAQTFRNYPAVRTAARPIICAARGAVRRRKAMAAATLMVVRASSARSATASWSSVSTSTSILTR